jgi:DNA-binding CsgD family transcriptional regulator/tetratricopeptide (TPR) repeat protein
MGSRVSCRELVGRGQELAVLDATYEAAAAGRAAAVLVGGDAGIGKTRLVEECCGRARTRGALTATGACVPVDGGGLPFGPVVGVMRDLARQLGEPAARALLGPLADGLAPGGEVPATSAATRRAPDELARTRLFESILTTLTRLAERAPLVLVFDDLQWADSATAELLAFLVRNVVDVPLLLVGTYRSEDVGRELRPWLSELCRHTRVTHVRLEGLAKDELAAMLRGILGHDADWTLLEAVWSRSQGNPFYAEELTAAGPSPTLPPELQTVIMTRVEAMSADTQRLLRVVAAAGADVEHRLLRAAGALDDDPLETALAEAVDRQLLVVDDTRYRFRHALLQEAVDAAVLPGERARVHQALARAITDDSALGPADPGHRAAALAAHWWIAGEWAEAYDASVQAAKAAAAVWAFAEAHAHYERALASADRMPAPPDAEARLHLLVEAAEAAYLSGAGRRGVELGRAAVELAESSGAEPSVRADLLSTLGRNLWSVGESDAAFAAYRTAIDLMPTDPPSAALARVLAEDARGLLLMSRFSDAARRCEEAIEVARAVGARAEEGHALNTLATARASLGHRDEGIAMLREALAIAEEVGQPEAIDRAYTNLSYVLTDAGRLEEAAQVVFDSLAACARLGFLHLNGAAANSTDSLVRLGRWAEADALLAEMGDAGIGMCATAPQLVPLPMEIRRGRFEEVYRLLDAADPFTAQLNDVQTRGLFHLRAAELALEEARPDDAFTEIERALALVAGTEDVFYGPEMCALGARALADGLEDARLHGRRVDADKVRLQADELVDEVDRLLALPVAQGAEPTRAASSFAVWCRAERSRLDGPDPEPWADVATRYESAREPYPVAYARFREAEALLRSKGAKGRVADCLTEAWRITEQLGARPLQSRVTQLARRARITLDTTVVAPSPEAMAASDLGLTPREVEVLGQLAGGRTDAEIAEALFISKKTASVHVSNLLRKLDMANRVEAGKVGQAYGLTG